MINIFIISFFSTCLIYSFFLFLVKREKVSFFKKIIKFTTIGYIITLILITLIMDRNSNHIAQSNFIPFKYIIENYDVDGGVRAISQYILNIFMFIPLGLLIPSAINIKNLNLKKIFIISFGVTTSIELLQILNGRAADIDDIIANTIGGVLGYIFYIYIKKIFNFISYFLEKNRNKSNY